MIKIEITGKGYLDLQASTAISFEFVSPLFKQSIAETGYSYPVEFPMTPQNRRLLGFLDLLDIHTDFQPYPCIISFNGIQLVQGTLNISSLNQERASCFILSYEFDVALLDTSIRKIPLGGVRSIVPTLYAEMYEHANALVDATADSSDYVFFPCKNERFYEGNDIINSGYNPPHTYGGVVNFWDYKKQSYFDPVPGNQVAVDGVSPAYNDLPMPKPSTFVPYPFVVPVIKYIAFFLGGYRLAGDWCSDKGIKKLCIYNTATLDSLGVWGVDFPMCKTNADIDLANHLPDISIADFLSALANMFNLSIHISAKEKEIRIDSKAEMMASAEEFRLIYDTNISISQNENLSNKGIKFSLTPDDTDAQQDFFKDLVITERIKPDEVSAFPATDAPGDIRFFSDTYRASIKGAGAFTEIPSAPTYIKGKGGLEKKAECGTLDTQKNLPLHHAHYDGISPSVPVTYQSGIIPIAQQIGNSEIYEVHEAYSLRLLFYAGMHPDPNGLGVYPIGTSNVYDDMGNQILPYSLKWRGGDFALYEAWWQKWEPIFYGKKISVTLLLSVTDFLNLDLTKKLRIGNRLYFIEKLQLQLSHNGLGKAKASCVQIPV